MRITIPGLPPPEDARSACDTLRPRYSRAVILVLAAYNGNAYANLRTIVIYGTTRLRPGCDVSLTMPAEGPRQDCFLVRRTVNAADADAFISQAITGSAAPPTTANDIGYRLESWWEEFLPRNSLDLRPSPSTTTSLWRRRRQPSKPDCSARNYQWRL